MNGALPRGVQQAALLLFGVARVLRWRYGYLPAFFAGFCLIANGAYLGAG